MKVLLANKFYYRRGGDCVCTLNLEQLLKDHNHDTAVFAMQHPENFPTPWSKYFPSEIPQHLLLLTSQSSIIHPFDQCGPTIPS